MHSLARVGGKFTTVFAIGGLIFSLRSLASSFEEVPRSSRGAIGWRDLHVSLMLAGLVGAIEHTVFQAYRMLEFATKPAYEYLRLQLPSTGESSSGSTTYFCIFPLRVSILFTLACSSL
jgi:hypothetical protein